jgi:hypothetical protein
MDDVAVVWFPSGALNGATPGNGKLRDATLATRPRQASWTRPRKRARDRDEIKPARTRDFC